MFISFYLHSYINTLGDVKKIIYANTFIYNCYLLRFKNTFAMKSFYSINIAAIRLYTYVINDYILLFIKKKYFFNQMKYLILFFFLVILQLYIHTLYY